MKTRALTLAAFLVISVSLAAQENEKIKYSNVTEFGFTAASPKGISFEATTAHGFSIEKQHHLGLGTGIGTILLNQGGYYNKPKRTNSTVYMPIFFNYRVYFKPDKKFSPHVNIAVGGLTIEDGAGVYSAVTMGFKVGAFSFSSGLSFMPYYRKYYFHGFFYEAWGTIIEQKSYTYTEWYYPFGMTLKLGFAF